MSDEKGDPEMAIEIGRGWNRRGTAAGGERIRGGTPLLRAEIARSTLLPILRAASIRLRETSSVRQIGLPPRATLRALVRELVLEVATPKISLEARLPAAGTIRGEISLDALDLARTVAVGATKEATVAIFATRSGPESSASIRIGERITRLAATPERGPRAPTVEGPELTLAGPALRDAIALVSHAYARGETATSRPILTAICLSFADGSVELVAADNYRLARTSLAVAVPASLHGRRIAVAGSSLRLLGSLLDDRDVLTLRVGGRELRFATAHSALVASIEPDSYPEYDSIVGQAPPTALARVGSRELCAALGSVVPIAVRGRSRIVRLAIGDRVVVTGADDERSTPVGERAGGEATVELGIDAAYLADAAKAAGEVPLTIGTNGPLVPLELGYAGVREWIMPVRIAR